WDNDAHRPRRIGLRASDTRHGRQRGSPCCEMQKSTAGKFHFEPPFTSLDHLIGAGKHKRRKVEADRSRCLEIDEELKLGRALDRKIGGFGALQYPIDCRVPASRIWSPCRIRGCGTTPSACATIRRCAGLSAAKRRRGVRLRRVRWGASRRNGSRRPRTSLRLPTCLASGLTLCTAEGHPGASCSTWIQGGARPTASRR